ncbi:hypothetical protein MUB24_21675 [Lederbergia sp. NSJ-179]|uniref:hypothetical protein n=1 Tax=Lederbergia sp. NSJ-179 TaxID=2931402 RepID=UPI001FD4E48D|nr:hypothetical protein [Lederbergia sp. NSJ-179]MCJ7843436.1 hypothetical protein [Lederbergia sp. NSJ-179]
MIFRRIFWDKIRVDIVRNKLIIEEKNKYIPLPIYIPFKEHYCQESEYTLHFHVYGDDIHSITDVLISRAHNANVLPVKINENGQGMIEIKLDSLKDLPPAYYSIFVRYNDYRVKTSVEIRPLPTRRL